MVRALFALLFAATAASGQRATQTADAANLSNYITSSGSRPPPRPAWGGPHAELAASPLDNFKITECGIDNHRAIDHRQRHRFRQGLRWHDRGRSSEPVADRRGWG